MIRRSLATAMLAAAVFPLAGIASPQDAPQRLATVKLEAGMFNIQAEVARAPREREIGLMHREKMSTYEGMLFVFDASAPQCFWMKNTLLPLSIAFIADDGTIVNVEDMAPRSEANHCSVKPVRYALEMNQGWFARRGFGAGSKLGGGPFAR